VCCAQEVFSTLLVNSWIFVGSRAREVVVLPDKSWLACIRKMRLVYYLINVGVLALAVVAAAVYNTVFLQT